MASVEKIEPFGDEGELRMIVETPRGATVKLKASLARTPVLEHDDEPGT